MKDQHFLRCEAVGWVDREWPGWVRVRLVDADGTEWFFTDKVPIFWADFGPDEDGFPLPVAVRCRLVQDDDQVLIVSTDPDHVEAENGVTQFRVRRDQVVNLPLAGQVMNDGPTS